MGGVEVPTPGPMTGRASPQAVDSTQMFHPLRNVKTHVVLSIMAFSQLTFRQIAHFSVIQASFVKITRRTNATQIISFATGSCRCPRRSPFYGRTVGSAVGLAFLAGSLELLKTEVLHSVV